jgi:glycosyltransferase involved in cell wall biosynthesis
MDGYRHAGAALDQSGAACAEPVPDAPIRTRISLLMIVKDEERFLKNCLESAREVVDEIVIVDTGSTDATQDIAREYGAKVILHTWKDDFSEARNVGLAHATGDWGLWLDADEEIAPGSGPAFREAVETARQDTGGFMVSFRNWLQSTTRDEESDMAVHHACRLFRLVPGVRFEGRIHEQNLRSLQEQGYQYAFAPGLTIDHFGYASEIMD